jgi:glycerophosphoryl diester phosphodiesterase
MRIIAHRGASGLVPENTIKSFKRAIKLGVDLVECDVRKTSDGELVIHHDPSLERTTNGEGLLKNIKLSELLQLDAGDGERIPTLKEVLDLVKGKVGLIIEIKEPGSEKEILNLVRNAKMGQNVIIASFFHSVSLVIKSLDPKVKTGVIFRCQPVNPLLLATDAQAEVIFPHHQFLNKLMVDEAHDHDIKVYPWVIDSKDHLKMAITLGVDGVITNHPEIINKNLFQQ